MKKLIITFLFLCFGVTMMTAQTPFQINYQGVARDISGTVIQNTNMRIRLTVYDLSPSGPVQYSETRMVQTNKFGLFTVAIGSSNGVITSTGKLSDVNWAANTKYLGVEIDPKGGNNFIQLGISQMLSVPYSLYSLASKDGLPSAAGQKGKLLTNNGSIPRWDTIHIPNYTSGVGLNIFKEHITVTDTAIFNASKILGGVIDITGRKNNNVLAWDSATNKYRYVPVEIITGPNLKYLQNGNNFGQTAIIGTIDSFDIKFKTNNKIVGRLDTRGEFSSTYIRAIKQFLAPASFMPNEPIILPNGETAYNGDLIPPYSFLDDPKTGISMETGDAPSITFVNKGKTLLRAYWEAGKIGDAAVLQGLGDNRFSIQSSSNMVHIAQTSRFEWEGFLGKYLDFVGYSSSSFQGKTFRFTTEKEHPNTPLAIMPIGNFDAFHVIDTLDNILSSLSSKGWLGINVTSTQAPIHIGTSEISPTARVSIIENNSNQEIFTTYNNRKSYFGERVYYRTNPVFKVGDDLALVNKKYVDDLFLINGLSINGSQTTIPIGDTKTNVLINPNITQDIVTLNFPATPQDGEEVFFYFGGTIESGIVAKKLAYPNVNGNIFFSNSLPSNILAGQVICFRWFSKSEKWFIK